MPDNRAPQRNCSTDNSNTANAPSEARKIVTDTLKALLRAFNNNHKELPTMLDRIIWSTSVCKSFRTCEANRMTAAEKTGSPERKNAFQSPIVAYILFPPCYINLCVWIKLTSHQCTHKIKPTEDDQMIKFWSRNLGLQWRVKILPNEQK